MVHSGEIGHSGHRKEVCKLLKAEFPDTQFLITTHEDVWLHHMMSEKLVTNKSVVRFRKWSVDDGPMVWNQEEIWTEIAKDLENDDVPAASASLRRFLEHTVHELSDKLRATVEFRGGGTYDLGDLLPSVTSKFSQLLGKAKEAAQSWRQSDVFERIKAMHDDFTAKLGKSNVEQWAINKTVHYTEWAQLQKEDFSPVVEAFKQLMECLTCRSCGVFYYASPAKGKVDTLRCDCTLVNFNLKKNPEKNGPATHVQGYVSNPISVAQT